MKHLDPMLKILLLTLLHQYTIFVSPTAHTDSLASDMMPVVALHDCSTLANSF